MLKMLNPKIRNNPPNIEEFNSYSGHLPDIWINTINKFDPLWKISSYWLENIKELLAKPFDFHTISVLAEA